MGKLSFSFEKPYDEIEIDGEVYKLYFDDESIKRYRDQATVYEGKVKDYLKKQDKVASMTDAEKEVTEQEGKDFAKEFIETFCGKGSFDKLYGASGKSMLNFMPLIEYIFEWLNGKIPDTDNKKKEYYTKKKKK